MSKMDSWLMNPQRRIGVAGLLALLVMGSLVAPLSLDMYTPAVPRMAEYFSTTNDMVNLTLVGYYLFFATASIMGAVGPSAWLRLSGRVSIKRFTTFALAASLVIGLAMMTVGHASAYVFCGLFLVFVFFESAVRPYNVNVLLDQQDGDTGSASALINFTCTLAGALGMFMITGLWSDYIFGLGVLLVSCAAISALLLVLLRARKGNRLL